MGEILEIHISGDGRYVGANDAALGLLGYTTDEVRALPLGALSGTDAATAAEVWSNVSAARSPIPAGGAAVILTKDGRHIPVMFLGTTPDGPGGSWISRSIVIGEGEEHAPIVTALREWRAAESRLAATPSGDPARPGREAAVEIVRMRYLAAAGNGFGKGDPG